MTDPHAGDRGFALLIVLWAVVLLALLGTGLAATGRTEVQIAASLRAAAAAEAAADGAVYEAAFHLLDPDQPWAADGRERVVLIADASVTVRIDNQAGKVSPNLAEPDLLRVLLRRLGTDTQTASRLSDAIADWRFPGSQPRPNGAKSPQYLAAGLDYGPPGTPFTDLDELGSVLGMTPDLLARMRPYLSVQVDMPPDPAVAAAPVRQALQDLGGAPPRADAPRPLRTILVTARANRKTGGSFTRRATLRLGSTAREAPVLILTWD